MRIRVLVLVVGLLVLSSCGSWGRHDVMSEPSPSATFSSPGGPMPTAIPPAGGLVRSAGPVTVLDEGDGAELCLGPVATSLPPRCAGPTLVGWKWSDYSGDFEEVAGVRFGSFAVTGSFDGTDFAPTRVVPLDEYDDPRNASSQSDPEDPGMGDPDPTGKETRRIQHRLTGLPGMLSASRGHDHVDIEVVHDDGSVQAWADGTYGPGVVRISSALVPASG